VRELTLVETINRRGADTLKTQEVNKRSRDQQGTPSTSQINHSSSPAKRLKLDDIQIDPIDFNMEEPDVSKKRQTMVFLFQL